MNKNIFPFDKFLLQESEEDLLKDLKSLGYESRYNWETIVKAMKSMDYLEDYISINWNNYEIFTTVRKFDGPGYLLNFDYPQDLFNVTVNYKKFIQDFINKLDKFNGVSDGWTLQEIEGSFKDVGVEYALMNTVDRKKGKVSFSLKTDTNMSSDNFGVSVIIKKEKDPPIENLSVAIKDILSDIEYYLENLDDRTTR